MKKIVISGYYGFDNLGDEAILAAVVQSLRELEENFSIVVLSNQPQVTAERYQVEAINRFNFKTIIKTIKKADIFISGGGSLLQDVTSWRTIPYYLGLVWLAQFFQLKTVFYAQGVGPINSTLNRKLVKWVGNRTDQITVRDRDSAQLLHDIGIDPGLVSVTVDPVFAFNPEQLNQNISDKLSDELNDLLATDEKLIGVSVRPWKDNSYLESMARGADLAADLTGGRVVFVPMHQGKDVEVSRKVQEMMDHDSTLLADNYTPTEMLEVYNNFDLFLGVRLHSLIFAAVNRVPFIGISYDPKVDSLMSALEMESGLTTDNCPYPALKKNIYQTWQNYDEIKQNLDQRVNKLYQKARDNVKQISN